MGKKQPSQSIRKSQQCIADTLKQQRCRKRTAHTPKCWIHLAKQDNLRIKPSNIINGGKGLFSWKKPIVCGAIISMGRHCTKKQIDQKYGNMHADYTVCNKRGKCIDANRTTDAAARFVNDSRGTSFQDNAKLKGNKMFRLKATKKIQPHREIFTSYGVDNIGIKKVKNPFILLSLSRKVILINTRKSLIKSFPFLLSQW